MKLYKNGQYQGEYDDQLGENDLTGDNNNIGLLFDPLNDNFVGYTDGEIDEVRIQARALSDEEISKQMR